MSRSTISGAAASRSRCPRTTAISDLDDAEDALAERLDGSHYRDDILRLLFICCHPDLPATQQIALALRIVSGLTVKQIARAFLVSEAAMEQRITRAKARVADADVPFETPGAVERTERLASGRRDDLSDLQRGLFGERRHRRDPRAAVRGGDPAGAAVAAAVPERAGDHGADGAAAAAACARRGALRRRRRAGAARRPGPLLVESEDDRRRPGADRQGDAPSPQRALSGPGRDRGAACPRRQTRRHRLDPDRPAVWRAGTHAAVAGGDAQPRGRGVQGARAGGGARDDRAAGASGCRIIFISSACAARS